MFKQKISHNHKLLNIIGWSGVVLILAAYAASSLNLVSAKSLSYQLANLFGAAALLVTSYIKKDYEPFVLNVVWLIVAALAILHSI